MGIYCDEVRECGCEIRRYTGGRIIQSGCNLHRSRVYFKCQSSGCEKEFKHKAKLTKHKWEIHAT